jgi:deoxyribodipyrimidine photo-lyase
VKHWVPELVRVPEEFLHTPWRMPTHLQQQVGCLIGEDYPEPIVNLFESAKENEQRFGKSRRCEDARQKMLW